MDGDRIKKCDRKSSVATKNSRKRSRAIRKGFGDKDAEKEGDVFLPGGFLTYINKVTKQYIASIDNFLHMFL